MSDVFRQSSSVSYEDKCRLMGQAGLVVWFTGLSGSGKSTIANEAERLLHDSGVKTCLLDGDNIRLGINSDLGFDDADRDENIRRVSEIAKLFCDSGIVALVAFISPFAAMREKARRLIGSGRFIEVYVSASLDACRRRDPKGLYKRSISNFTGIDSAYQPPRGCELTLDTEKMAVNESSALVTQAVMERLGKSGE